MDYFNANFWTTFLTLACLEIVLGIDNLIFHSLTIAKLPLHLQKNARILGMGIALGCRFLLLWGLVWLMSLTHAAIGVGHESFSARDVVLFLGGAFLAIKSVLELCKPEEQTNRRQSATARSSMKSCILQIVVLDIIFSLDSVITAVGMANDLFLIMLAIVSAMVVMTCFSAKVSEFLAKHARIRALAFLFIAFIGGAFIMEAFGQEVPKIYIYALTAFALGVELMRLEMQKRLVIVPPKKSIARPRIKFDEIQSHREEKPVAVSTVSKLQNSHCANCNSHHMGYSFCVQCGSGLGVVSIPLGEFQYE